MNKEHCTLRNKHQPCCRPGLSKCVIFLICSRSAKPKSVCAPLHFNFVWRHCRNLRQDCQHRKVVARAARQLPFGGHWRRRPDGSQATRRGPPKRREGRLCGHIRPQSAQGPTEGARKKKRKRKKGSSSMEAKTKPGGKPGGANQSGWTVVRRRGMQGETAPRANSSACWKTSQVDRYCDARETCLERSTRGID
jgi:hypothetical protein